MLNFIVGAALRYKVLVIAAFLVLAALGVRAWQHVPLDAFPDVAPKQVNIYTEAPGLAAEDVERLVTTPIETTMAGLPDVQVVRSVSLFGLSYVSLFFQERMSVVDARRYVAERLPQARARLSAGVGEPELGPNTSSLGQVYWYALEAKGPGVSLMDLRTAEDWNVRTKVRAAAGVDDVMAIGGSERQYQVLIQPQWLLRYQLGFSDVLEALRRNNRQVGGEYVNLGAEQYLVRGLGTVTDIQQIADLVVTTRGHTPIRVRDIAQVVEGPGLRFGAATRNGHEVVLGEALARVGESAEAVVAGVKAKLEIARRTLPAGIGLVPVYDRTDLIGKAIAATDRAMIEGVALVIAVLFVFMGNVRSALVVVVAIPLARLIAFLFMDYFGVSANLMSLGGLIVGLGMTIDGPVVLVENAFRRLAHAGAGADRDQVMQDASSEVLGPILFGVAIIIVVFLPLFALGDLEGKLFAPLAQNMVFAMLGSLVLTLTLVPALGALGLRPGREREPRFLQWLCARYRPVLRSAMVHRKAVTLAALLMVIGALVLLPRLGKEFVPQLQEQEFVLRIASIPSTSLDESIRISQQAESVLAGFPEVKSSLATIGRAEKGDTTDVNYMEILVELNDRAHWPIPMTYQALGERLREKLESALPTVVISGTQPIQMRVEELISGVRATLAAKVYGEDLATLDRLAAEIQNSIAKIPGATQLSVEANRGKPQLVIQVDRDAAGRLGISVDDILTVIQAGIGGQMASTVVDGIRRIDIQIWLPQALRSSVEAIGNIPIRADSGASVLLSQVAHIRLAEGYAFIRHEQAQRYAVIGLDVEGRDVDGFVRDANARLRQEVQLPTGYWMEWGGAFENQQRALGTLTVIVPMTVAFIFLLLYTAFRSLRYATLIIANVPFAAVGGVTALYLSHQYLSVPAAIGFIGVFGVAMLNGLVLVSFLNRQRASASDQREAVIEGTLLRLRPVLMTALVEILGLLPFLLSTGVGAEVLRPLATVVVGGLLTSTILTLLLVPVVYDWMPHPKS